MYIKLLTVDVEDAIRRLNIAGYDVMFNTPSLSEVVQCELVGRKCLPVLLYSTAAVHLQNLALYKLHIVYRKIISFYI